MDGSPGGGRARAEPAAVTAPGDTSTTAVFLYSGQKDGPPAACRVVARQGRRVRLELPGGKQVWREREHVLQPAELAVAALRRTLMVLPDPVGFCRGLDRNGDGVVTAAELAQGAAEAGVCLGSDECAALIELADQDGDGLLSVRELEMLAAVLQDVRALQADLCPQPPQQQPRASAVLAVQLYTERPLTDAERRRPRRRRGRPVPICGGVLVAETLVFLPPNARRSELLAALSAELSLEEGGQHGHALEGLRERLGPGAGSEWEAVVSKFQKDPTVADLLSLGRSLPTPSHSDSVAGIQPPAVALELTHTDARWLTSWTAQQYGRLRYSLARQRLALASILHPRLCPAAIDTTELSDVFGLIFGAGALMAAHRYTRAREHTPGRIDVPPGRQPTQPPNQPDDLAWLNELGPLITMQASKLYFAIRRED